MMTRKKWVQRKELNVHLQNQVQMCKKQFINPRAKNRLMKLNCHHSTLIQAQIQIAQMGQVSKMTRWRYHPRNFVLEKKKKTPWNISLNPPKQLWCIESKKSNLKKKSWKSWTLRLKPNVERQTQLKVDKMTNSFGNEYLLNLTTLAIPRDMLKLVKILQVMFFQQGFVGGFEGAKKNLISLWKGQKMMFLQKPSRTTPKHGFYD